MLQFETLVKAAGITDEALLRSPAISAAIGRMDGTKVAAAATTIEFGRPDVSLEEMLTEIGTKLAMAHLRQRQIDAGLASLDVLTGTTKEANILSRLLGRAAPAAARAGQAAHAAEAVLPAAEQMTHLVGTQAGVGRVNRAMGDALGAGFAREIPAYARDVAHGGTFTPMELPLKRPVAAAPAPAGALRTKARPTMSMPAAEMPAMHTRTGTGGVSRAVNMGPGGAGILPHAPTPGGATTFQGVPGASAGSTEAPAMFNLADLMKGQKQAADAQLLNDALLSGAMIGGPMAAVAAPMNAWAAPDNVKGEAFLRPALNLGVGATGGGAVGHLGGALLGRATGSRNVEGVLRGLGTLSGAVGGSVAMNDLSRGLVPYSDSYDAWLSGGGVPEKRASETSTALREKTAVSTTWINDMVRNYAADGAGPAANRLGRLQQASADNLHRSNILWNAMEQDMKLWPRLSNAWNKRYTLGARSGRETLPDAQIHTRIEDEARDNTVKGLLQSLRTTRAPAIPNI